VQPLVLFQHSINMYDKGKPLYKQWRTKNDKGAPVDVEFLEQASILLL